MQIENYNIIKLIKNNSKFSRVFIAQKKREFFVVKEFLFNKEGQEAFLTEKSITQNFAPPITDVFIYNNKGVIVRKFIEHKTLIEYCKKPFLTKKRKFYLSCINIFIKILQTLSNIHKNNIIHNDLKQGNILIENDTNKVYFIDFAMAKLPDTKKQKSSFSLIFSPPEHILKFYDLYTPDTDLYMLALTFWSALNNGKLPFYHSNPEILINIQLNMPLPQARLDKDLYTILHTASYKTPLPKPPLMLKREYLLQHILSDKNKRFQTTIEFIKKLTEYKINLINK